MIFSPLAGKTLREIVLGPRGGVHIAHPLAETALCGAKIAVRHGIDAYSRDGVILAYGGCDACLRRHEGGGNEERALGCYA